MRLHTHKWEVGGGGGACLLRPQNLDTNTHPDADDVALPVTVGDPLSEGLGEGLAR